MFTRPGHSSNTLGKLFLTVTLLLSCVSVAGGAADIDMSGVWNGTYESPGAETSLKLSITIKKSSGRYSGSIALPDEKINMNIQQADLDDDYFTVSSVLPVTGQDGRTSQAHVTFGGSVSDDGTEWEGTWAIADKDGALYGGDVFAATRESAGGKPTGGGGISGIGGGNQVAPSSFMPDRDTLGNGHWEGTYTANNQTSGTLYVSVAPSPRGFAGDGRLVDSNDGRVSSITFPWWDLSGKRLTLEGTMKAIMEDGEEVPASVTMSGDITDDAWHGVLTVIPEGELYDEITANFDLKRGRSPNTWEISEQGYTASPPRPPSDNVIPPLTANAVAFAPGQRNTLFDREWNMPAMMMDIPSDWSGEYEIAHLPYGTYAFTYTLRNPRTGQWIQNYPSQLFVYLDYQGPVTPQMAAQVSAGRANPPRKAGEITRLFLNQRQRQNLRVISSAANTDAELNKMRAEFEPLMRPIKTQSGQITPVSFLDQTDTLVEYEDNGRLYRERIIVVVSYIGSKSFEDFGFVKATTERGRWMFSITTAGSPAERADQAFFKSSEAVCKSKQELPQWKARLEQALAAQTQADNKKIMDISDAQLKIAQSRQQVLNDRAAAQSRAFNNMIDVIAGREWVQSPYGGKLQIDYMKNHAWVDKNNNIVYSDSSLYDPNQLPGSSGTYLQIK